VLAAKGPTPWGVDQDDVVYMPMTTAKKRVFGGRQLRGDLLGQITVKAASSEVVKQVERDIGELLRRRHRLAADTPDDYVLRNLAEALETRMQSARIMASVLASVAAISLLVGGIGIMNIMLVTVTERTREIGLRMAVGARRRDVERQVVLEALLFSVVGGLVGVGLGIAGSAIVSQFAGWPVLIGADAVAIAILSAAAVGVFFGYWPARRASRLDPVEALRQE